MPMFLSVQREVGPDESSGSVSQSDSVPTGVSVSGHIPSDEVLHEWAQAAQIDPKLGIEINLRIVSPAESQLLNKTYRGNDLPTNVLSFVSQVPAGSGIDLLGDIVICADIVAQEAKKYGKTLPERWAHMLVHGCLHVQGLDHGEEPEREFMEAEEIRILKGLGIQDPYQVN